MRRKRGKPVGERAAQRTTRTALDRLGSGKLWVPAQPPLGTMGAGGRHETICERKRAKTMVFRVSEGQRRGVSPFRRVAAFRRCWCVGTSNEKGGRNGKRRALRGTMGSRTGRKGETACLARPWKLRRPGGYRPGGFPYRKSDDQGTGDSLKENL